MPSTATTPSPAYPSPLPDAGSAATEWALGVMHGPQHEAAWITPVVNIRNPSEWTGGRYAALAGKLADHAGHYVSIGVIKEGSTRSDDNVEAVAVLVFDDVGDPIQTDVKMDSAWLYMRLEPTFIVETSLGNYQWSYVFDTPVGPDDYRILIDGLKLVPEAADGIKDGTSLSRYVRLPSGKNPKAEKGGFKTRLVAGSGKKYSLAEISAAFGVEHKTTGAAGAGKAKSAPIPEALALPAAEALALLDEIEPLIRNNGIGREDWIGIIYGFFNASGQNDDVEDIIDRFTAKREDGPTDPVDDFEHVWETRHTATKAGLTTLIRWLEKQATPEATAMVHRIRQTQAKTKFTAEAGDNNRDNPPGPGAEPADEPAEPSLNLFDELARLGGVHPKKEIILPGFERGFVTLVGGPSGSMKSLWMLQVALAICSGQQGVADKLMSMGEVDYHGSVVFYPYEDAPSQLAKRLDAMIRVHKLDVKKFAYQPLVRTGQLLRWKNAEELTLTKGEVEALVAIPDLALIVIDTLTSALLSEETNREFQQVMVLAKGLAARTGAAVVIVHHFRKGVSKEEEGATMESMRGGSSLTAAARNVLFVEPPSKKEAADHGLDGSYMKRTHIKNTNGPLDMVRWFEREVADIDVVDRRNGKRGVETAPALLPFTAAWSTVVPTKIKDALAKIVEAETRLGRKIQIVGRNDGQADIAQNVLGLATRETRKIISDLERFGLIRRIDAQDAQRKIITTIEVINSAQIRKDDLRNDDFAQIKPEGDETENIEDLEANI